jgi:hypothetical protein
VKARSFEIFGSNFLLIRSVQIQQALTPVTWLSTATGVTRIVLRSVPVVNENPLSIQFIEILNFCLVTAERSRFI